MMVTGVIVRIAFLIFLIAIPVGVIFLQIFLSKMEGKWMGLILPIITLAFSLMTIMGMAVYVHPGPITEMNFVDGELITTVIHEAGGRELIPGAIGAVVYTFVIMNIPTAVLLIIYKAVRGKQNRNRDLEKMSVQDL